MSTSGLGMKIRAGGAYVTLGVNDKLSGGLLMAERKLQAFGQRVGALGAKMGAASLAMLGPNIAAAKTFAGFEQSMAKVRAIINPTAREFELLNEKAKLLGATTQFTASDAARGMATFAQANFKTNQILAAMLPTLDLAAAGEMDVAEAADIAAQIMNSMNISADKVGVAIDVLTKATQTANTDLRQLGHAFTYAGAIASSAGASFEEATVFLQMMSNAGIKADMAGTTLRGALLALTSPSQMARERLAELGVDVDTLEGNFISLSEVIRQFELKMGSMGTAERMRFLGDIFDNRQASGFAKAVANGAEIFREMEKSLYNSTGAARKFAATMMGTLTGSVLYLKSAFEGLQIAIGETTADTFHGFLAGMTSLVNQTMEFVKANKELMPQLIAVGAAVGMVGGSLLGLSFVISTVSTLLSPFTFALSAVIGLITTFASLAPMLLNPWVAVPVAIAAVILALSDWAGAANSVGTHLADWSDWMVTTFRYAFNGISNAIKAGNLELAVKILMTSIKFAFAKTLKEITELFHTTIKDMVATSLMPIRMVMLTIAEAKKNYDRVNAAATYANFRSSGKSEQEAQRLSAEATRRSRESEAMYEFWRTLDVNAIGQSVADSLDTSALFQELVDLRRQAENEAINARLDRENNPGLGPAREVPELRLPDGVINGLTPEKLAEAAVDMRDATQFAATGSFGGAFLDRMRPGTKPAAERLVDLNKKMLEEQQQTNDILEDMEGPTFGN